jgi:hypothetical protein
MAGQQLVMASVGSAPWPSVAQGSAGRIAAARSLFQAKPDDATLLIAMGQEAAAAHNEARRLDPLRWVTLEEGLGLPTLLPAPAARRRGDGPLRIMVDAMEGSVTLPALPGVELEFLGSLPPELALRKARHADLWVCADEAGRHRALTAAQGGAALLVPALPAWDWVARCRGGVACATPAFGQQMTALCSDRAALSSSGERDAVYVQRHGHNRPRRRRHHRQVLLVGIRPLIRASRHLLDEGGVTLDLCVDGLVRGRYLELVYDSRGLCFRLPWHGQGVKQLCVVVDSEVLPELALVRARLQIGGHSEVLAWASRTSQVRPISNNAALLGAEVPSQAEVDEQLSQVLASLLCAWGHLRVGRAVEAALRKVGGVARVERAVLLPRSSHILSLRQRLVVVVAVAGVVLSCGGS